MSALPMAGLPEETPLVRAIRLERAARIMRAAAEDAVAENQRAYERATEALQRAEHAEHEAEAAMDAWERSQRPAAGSTP
jgi:hypothetical protein